MTNSKLLFFAIILSCATLVNAQESIPSFDGKDNHIETSSEILNQIGTGDFTFEAWIIGNESQPTHPTIFSNRPSQGVGVMFFFHDLWGPAKHKMLCVQLNDVNYILIDNGTYNGSLLDGQCHHVAIAKGEEIITFYVDGEEIGIRNLRENPTTNAAHTLWIGKDAHTNNTFNGGIHDVRIWNEVRTAEQIKNNYKELTENNGNLLAHFVAVDGKLVENIELEEISQLQRIELTTEMTEHGVQWISNACFEKDHTLVVTTIDSTNQDLAIGNNNITVDNNDLIADNTDDIENPIITDNTFLDNDEPIDQDDEPTTDDTDTINDNEPVSDSNNDNIATIDDESDTNSDEIVDNDGENEDDDNNSFNNNDNIISISTIEINIFPNPTQNLVTIDISKTTSTGNKIIKLFNLLGSQIREVHTVEGQYQYQLNLADLASSTYLVQVIEEGQIIGSGKIIKIE